MRKPRWDSCGIITILWPKRRWQKLWNSKKTYLLSRGIKLFISFQVVMWNYCNWLAWRNLSLLHFLTGKTFFLTLRLINAQTKFQTLKRLRVFKNCYLRKLACIAQYQNKRPARYGKTRFKWFSQVTRKRALRIHKLCFSKRLRRFDVTFDFRYNPWTKIPVELAEECDSWVIIVLTDFFN